MYDDPEYLQQGYSKMSSLVEKFKETWKHEYLTALREKHSTVSLNQNVPVVVGDIVLVETTGQRESWPLARVTRLLPDDHNQVRAVEVFSEGQYLIKTLNKLVNLEIRNIDIASNEPAAPATGAAPAPMDDTSGQEEVASPAAAPPDNEPPMGRPRRAAANRARGLFKDLGSKNLI